MIAMSLAIAPPVDSQPDAGTATVGPGIAEAVEAGPALVSVAFDTPPESIGSGGAAATIARHQDQILRALPRDSVSFTHRFTHLPGMTLLVEDSAAITAIAAVSGVSRIDLDVGGAGSLATAVAVTGADTRHAAGNDGTGVVVAVLDSGIAGDHGALLDDIRPGSQHGCFGYQGANGAGFCPNGTPSQFGAGAASDDEGHGTHVSGIITDSGSVGSPGFAPGAEILPIKVLSSTGSFSSFTLNIVAALDYLIDHPEFGVNIINMSLGTNARFNGDCDTATSWSRLGAIAVNTLRARGVTAFAAAGNDSDSAGMGAPACLSNVISVAASDDSDIAAGFTNVSPTTDIFAPGVGISASGLPGGVATMSGTSMASPAAAACAALLMQSGEATTPASIEAALEASGTRVTAANGASYPRIDCSRGPRAGHRGFTPRAPTRVLDSRAGYSPPAETGINSGVGTWGPGVTQNVQLAGIGTVPAGAVAVAAHVTSVNPTANTYLEAWPAPSRSTAVKNFGPTQLGALGHAAITNDLLVLPVDAAGTVPLFNAAGSVDLVIDVVGYFSESAGDGYVSRAPVRILDSRPGMSPPAEVGPNAAITTWGQRGTQEVVVTGVGGVPVNASAVAMHVTSVNPTAASFLTIWPDGPLPTPLTAAKNYGPTATGAGGHAAVTNDLLIVPVGADGKARFYNNAGSVDLVIDVVGWFVPGAITGYNPIDPTRVLDSRPGQSPLSETDINSAVTTWAAAQTQQVKLVLPGIIPSGATSAVLHVTSVTPSANSYLTAWPFGPVPSPLTAAKNYGPTQAGPGGHAAFTNDLLVVPIGPDGNIRLYNAIGTVDHVVDVVGYFSPT